MKKLAQAHLSNEIVRAVPKVDFILDYSEGFVLALGCTCLHGHTRQCGPLKMSFVDVETISCCLILQTLSCPATAGK